MGDTLNVHSVAVNVMYTLLLKCIVLYAGERVFIMGSGHTGEV